MSKFILVHEGVKRRSGRYPYGSGEVPYQHEPWFTWSQKEKNMRSEGLSDVDIAKGLGMSTTVLRQMRSIAASEKRAADSAWAYKLKQKGYSNVEIGKIMKINESQVRSLLKPHTDVKAQSINNTADILAKHVNKSKYLDVGAGTELYLGVSQTKKDTALQVLKQKGYNVYYIKVEQQNNPGSYTTMKILAPPDVDWKTVNNNRDKIHPIEEHTTDNGKTYFNIEPPVSVDSKRVYVRYAEDGGKAKDGTIELRRGVEDISLGDNRYAQVRIAVDDKYYLKGMALYSNDIPKGYDIVYNTNKSDSVAKNDVFKKMNTNPDGTVNMEDPFSAVLRANGQRHYIDKNGKDCLSAINIVNQEGDWEKYKKQIASQMLAKQSVPVAQDQLNISYREKKAEFDEISRLTNPVVKKTLLKSFADDCDASAVHLKAASFPRQASRVLLPLTDIKENEVYAPGFKQGERVVLIRFPHGGKFEIPELIVNNRNRDGIETISNKAKDAVGIHSSVAERLSGADFDGDTVLVIPNNSGKIKTSPALDGLKNFDPKESYPAYPGMPKVSETNFDTQLEMGKISNLITDMTLKGATDAELARAVRHSMTVIDAEKHNLDHKTSEIDNRIDELRRTYQMKDNGKAGGASTLISLAKSPVWVHERDESRTKYDPETGEKIYYYTENGYEKKTGEWVYYKQKSTRMAETPDARTLSSGTKMEETYAEYANKLKALANEARKAYVSEKTIDPTPSARTAYAKEVDSLTAKLDVAERNAPNVRKAQLVAEQMVNARVKDNPSLKDKGNEKELNKVRQKALAAAITRYNAKSEDNQIVIEPKEWEAIQAGAISTTKLERIMKFTDTDKLKEYATPRTSTGLSSSKKSLAISLLNRGYPQSEVAERLGISVSTLIKYVDF